MTAAALRRLDNTDMPRSNDGGQQRLRGQLGMLKVHHIARLFQSADRVIGKLVKMGNEPEKWILAKTRPR